MARPQQYFQVGGFGASTWQTKVEDIADTYWRSEGIDLLFGVKPTGATYLFCPGDQSTSGNSRNPRTSFQQRNKPTYSTELLSVSPVAFTSYEEFLRCLKDYAHKATGKKNQDNSKTNKGLDPGPETRNIPTELGTIRGSFEKQRVLLRAYTNILKPSPMLYALAPSPRLSETRFVSFTYTLWEKERRNPLVMDIGWAEFQLTAGANGFQLKSCHHIATKEHSHLRNPGTKVQDFAYGTTERLPLAEAGTQLKNFLSSSPVPTIIFTHESPRFKFKPRDILHLLGIETVTWQTGLESLDDLLQPATAASVYGAGRGQNNSRYQDYESHHYQVRTANAHSQKASFHTVDVRSLVVKGVRFVEMQDDTLQGNAEYLRVQGMVAGGNAGNDAWTLGQMWYTMASGGTFLQQKALIDDTSSSATATPAPDPGQSTLQYPDDDDDEERDPNDVAPMASAAPVAKARDPYEMLDDEDDDDDNGGDSDSDSD